MENSFFEKTGKKLKIYEKNKTPLGETGCFSNNAPTLLVVVSQASSFLILPPSPNTIILPRVTYHLLCSACVTYGTLCHAVGH